MEMDPSIHPPCTEQPQGPLFICGTSRSGTTLLQAALERNPTVGIAAETHYFDDLRIALGAKATSCLDSTAARRTEDYFLALSHRPFGHGGDPEQGFMKREALRAHAESLGGSADAYFEAFCREWGAARGATYWGEKTPRHVFRITEMLERFPQGRVVFMLRDPRAVVASYRDWRNQGGFDFHKDPGHRATLEAEHERTRRSYHPVTISLLWVAATRAAIAAQRRFGMDRVRIQRYEALCDSPEDELGAIFDWLGLARPESMTSVPISNSSYEKFSKEGGFVRTTVDRWQQTLSSAEIRVVERCCGRLLREVGYTPARPSGSMLRSLWLFMTAIPALVRATVVNARRSGNISKYIARRAGLLLGRA